MSAVTPALQGTAPAQALSSTVAAMPPLTYYATAAPVAVAAPVYTSYMPTYVIPAAAPAPPAASWPPTIDEWRAMGSPGPETVPVPPPEPKVDLPPKPVVQKEKKKRVRSCGC
mmetsp:Transcript_26833/g.59294  ORF Transcript_26833/g.59294 Transcript_26833/m.59294 type:complete len:113 (+) Transcript_26833:55-393(+)